MFKQIPKNPQLRVSLEPLIHIDEDWHEILKPKFDDTVDKECTDLKPVRSTTKGIWAMISLLTLKDCDYKEEQQPEYKDGRMTLIGNHYLAYSFAGQQLYCVREVEGERGAYYAIPLTDLGKSNWEEFRALNQYRPALLEYGAQLMSENVVNKLNAVIEPMLPFVDVQTESIDLNNVWMSSAWQDPSKTEQFITMQLQGPMVIGDFESILKGYEFDSELQLMVRRGQKLESFSSTICTELEEDTLKKETCFPSTLYERLKDSNIGVYLKNAREAKGLSQSELAELTGKTQAQISNMESGKSEPSLKYLLMLSEITHKSMGEITGEVCADWVGKLIWIGEGYMGQMTCNKSKPYSNFEVRYSRYRVVGNDPVEKVIFVVPSKPEITGISRGAKDFDFTLEVFESEQYNGLSAFPLRGGCFKILENTDNYNKDNVSYPDIAFIPQGSIQNDYISATGGWSMKDNSPRLPGGFRFFDHSGNLIPIEGYAEPKDGTPVEGYPEPTEDGNER